MLGVRQGISSIVTSRHKYPTRLKDGVELLDHDDWDCAEDMEKLGLIINKGTGISPIYEMTDKGNHLVSRLRAHKARGGSYSNFIVGTV
jgi:predicted transcriptional regulator